MGNIDVGTKIATGGTPQSRIEAPNAVRIKRSANCGAMSQQCGDSGNYSMPQKLVQLVGFRDPKARSEPWVRPGPAKP